MLTPDTPIPVLWDAAWTSGLVTLQVTVIRVKHQGREFLLSQIWMISGEAGQSSLAQWSSKCGPSARTWELVRNANSRATPQPTESEILEVNQTTGPAGNLEGDVPSSLRTSVFHNDGQRNQYIIIRITGCFINVEMPGPLTVDLWDQNHRGKGCR